VTNVKNRKKYCRTRIMARKLKNVEIEKHCMTWNMLRNSEKGGK
jgi:hypothetical protein